MDWSGQRVAVIGLGVSNTALIRYLARQGAQITACDRKSAAALGETHRELTELGVTSQLGEAYLEGLDRFDHIFLTPGMPKDLPPVRNAAARGVPVRSEIQLLFELCPAPIVGITGAAGKTTTTSLIGEMLAAAGRTVHVGGNIGRPLIDRVEDIQPTDWVVLELSSFQLDRLGHSPQFSVVTNITPNHLQEHGSLEAYVAAKKEIFQHQRPDDWVVLNLDNRVTEGFTREAPSRVRTFSMHEKPGAHVFLREDRIVIARPDGPHPGVEEVCRRDEVRLLGRHNLANVLAAVAVADLCGVPIAAMREVIRTFRGVPHRLELVREADGVRYYNDSISTTPERAIAGILAFEEPLILIAGGYDKGLPFDEMAKAICERVKRLIVIGATAPAIRDAVERQAAIGGGRPEIVDAATLIDAVRAAVDAAEAGDVVLFSPGCSSFDMFENFVERGEAFRRMVHQFDNVPLSSAAE